MTTTYDESDASEENRTLRPIRDPRIGRFDQRLAKAIGARSIRDVARSAGISDATVHGLLKGALPTMENAVKLAGTLGVRVGWLATGELPEKEIAVDATHLEAREHRPEWPARAPLSANRIDDLARIIATVDAFLGDIKLRASPELKAQLIASMLEAAEVSGSLDGLADNLKRALDFLTSMRDTG
ncbi:hypothetical protein THICB3320727 [Thiomonas sp. CB3]|nr:hypothetical protein THICB3320727 [Thiomonas sp. CB3]